jgi:hypothetical protein
VTHLTQFAAIVIPAKAGIQRDANWTPAFAGVTVRKVNQQVNLPAVLRGAIGVTLGVVNSWRPWMVWVRS